MPELLAAGEFTLIYQAKALATGNNVTVRFFTPPDFIAGSELTMIEIGHGLYRLTVDFSEEQLYLAQFFENGVPTSNQVYRVHKLKETLTDIQVKTANLPSDPTSKSDLAAAHGEGSWLAGGGFASAPQIWFPSEKEKLIKQIDTLVGEKKNLLDQVSTMLSLLHTIFRLLTSLSLDSKLQELSVNLERLPQRFPSTPDFKPLLLPLQTAIADTQADLSSLLLASAKLLSDEHLEELVYARRVSNRIQ